MVSLVPVKQLNLENEELHPIYYIKYDWQIDLTVVVGAIETFIYIIPNHNEGYEYYDL